MSYGRRFPGVVRRGRRTYNRTSRMGYSARKALRRSLPIRKRLLRSKASGRPLKKRRVQTRNVAWSRNRSLLKSQREIIATSFMGNTDSSMILATQTPNATQHIYSQVLAPKYEVGANPVRVIDGTHANLMGCNIKGTLNIKGDFLIRVVQLLDMDIDGGTGVVPASSAYTDDFFKGNKVTDNETKLVDYEDYTFQERMYAPVNVARFKILKTKYIRLRPNAEKTIWQKKGFHFFVPMDARLHTDGKMTCSEWGTNRSTSTGVTTVTRYKYFKPVMIIIEPILRTGDSYVAASGTAFGHLDMSIKYTFKDSV